MKLLLQQWEDKDFLPGKNKLQSNLPFRPPLINDHFCKIPNVFKVKSL